ncbi:MAG: YIP1 family protein [Pelolinea sp.]|nr:YIP1 family protein [Pelolinea sp.]
MIERIIKVFTFKNEVYKEVEEDASFTPTAWVIVAVVAFLSQLGANAALVHVDGGSWLMGTITGTITAVLGFALGCFAISWAGKTIFKADVSFEEMVRMLGLANVWSIIGFVGILGAISPTLVCITGPFALIAAFAGLAAWFIAAKEALDLEWPQTIGAVIIGWVISSVIAILLRNLIGGLFGM